VSVVDVKRVALGWGRSNGLGDEATTAVEQGMQK
jgi:hypothetical protein